MRAMTGRACSFQLAAAYRVSQWLRWTGRPAAARTTAQASAVAAMTGSRAALSAMRGAGLPGASRAAELSGASAPSASPSASRRRPAKSSTSTSSPGAGNAWPSNLVPCCGSPSSNSAVVSDSSIVRSPGPGATPSGQSGRPSAAMRSASPVSLRRRSETKYRFRLSSRTRGAPPAASARFSVACASGSWPCRSRIEESSPSKTGSSGDPRSSVSKAVRAAARSPARSRAAAFCRPGRSSSCAMVPPATSGVRACPGADAGPAGQS